MGLRIAILSLLIVGCENKAEMHKLRGRDYYYAYCTPCHNPNTNHLGTMGPALFSTPDEVFYTKVPYGLYPDNYKPKRQSSAMPTFSNLRGILPDIINYIHQNP